MVASAASYQARPIQAAAAAASLLGRGEEETETAGLLLRWIHRFLGAGMFMPGSGRVGRAMAVEFILVMMGASMLGSSSGRLSMVLDTTIFRKFLEGVEGDINITGDT
ncbi:hypothetical protein AHAS_Ahas18G0258400 [Arachis hypogaea]